MERLPKDVLFRLALDMNFNDIISLSQTNRVFTKVFKNITFWYNKIGRDFPEINFSMVQLREWHNKIKYLDEQIFYDRRKIKALLIDILDYLHFSSPIFHKQLELFMGNFGELKYVKEKEEGDEKYFFARESNSNVTDFEHLSNYNLLGSQSKKKDEALFILNLLRLKVDKTAFSFISVFNYIDKVTLKVLLNQWTTLYSFEVTNSKNVHANIWDYNKIKKWLENEFHVEDFYGF